MWKNITAIQSIFKKKITNKNFNQVNIEVKSIKIILKKTKEKINEKKRKIRKVEKKK
jgi:hypothetical protein